MSSFWKFFSGEEGAQEGPPAPGAAAADGDAAELTTTGKPPAVSKGPKMGSTPPPSLARATKLKSTPPPPPDIVVEPTPQAGHVGPGLSARYGIDDAIRLMRTLPVEENVDLVVRVMKTTLESLKVRVGEIIDDATRRQDSLQTKIDEYQTQIAQLEREIDARKHEIVRLQEDLGETTKVKERLQLAETLTGGTPHAGAVAPRPRLPTRSKPPPPPEVPRRPASIPAKSEIDVPPAPISVEAVEDKPS
jgi:hypothetical protein